MRRNGNAGVLVVSLYLALHHVWQRYRPVTIVVVCGILCMGVLIHARRTPLPMHSSAVLNIPARPVINIETVHPTPPPAIPQGHPLFRRAQKLFHADQAWSWGGWNHAEYRWLSDIELFYAEQYESDPGYRIQRSHLYRYNVQTGRRRHLRRLERLVDCFYHSQMEISPDGKWLLWHGGTAEQETMDAATLDGQHHQQWPRGFYSLHWLAWTQDSRHWIEFQRTGSYQPPSTAIVHNVHSPAENRSFPMDESILSAYLHACGIGDHILSIDRLDETATTRSFNVRVSSLPPQIRQERIEKIAVPANLPNPNITEVLLSPDARRLAFIVGYGATPATTDPNEGTQEGDTSTNLSVNSSIATVSGTQNAKLRAYSLFVCRVDGSEMHEVGTRQEEVNPNVVLALEDLRWLPSGKRLSFFYKDTLYTVPAD